MTVFQNELDDATINALPKLKQSIALLLKKTNLTLGVVEASTYLSVTELLTTVPGNETFLIGTIYCNHPLSYIQLLGVSPATLKNRYKEPKKVVSELLIGIKKRLKAAIYLVVYSSLCSPLLKENHSGQIVLGFQFLEHSIIKSVPIMGPTETIKSKISFAALTYLKNYLLHYQDEAPAMASHYA